MTSLEEVEARLLKLEKRRFKQLGTVALIVAAVIVFMGQAPSKKILEANEFILRDDSGNVRMRLAMDPQYSGQGPQMLFLDEKGKTRLRLDGKFQTLTDGGSSISVYDDQGQERGFFAATTSTGAIVSILGPGGAARIATGKVEVADSNGFSATLGSEELETPRTGETHQTSAASLVLFDKEKNVIWRAP